MGRHHPVHHYHATDTMNEHVHPIFRTTLDVIGGRTTIKLKKHGRPKQVDPRAGDRLDKDARPDRLHDTE